MLRTDLPEIVTDTLPGPKAAAVIERRKKAVPSAIGCVYPVVINRGEGAMIEDVDGNKFLDWVGGVGVLNIGYSQPEIIESVKEQADRYFHGMFNIVTHEGYVALAEKLSAIAPVRGSGKKAFFANSGAEADENAVKAAKAYTGRPNIIVFSGAFHGRTLLTMTMTSKKSYTAKQGPLAPGVFRARFPYYYRNPEGLPQEKAVDYYMQSILDVFEECGAPDTIAAIVVEPLQGEGGFIPAPLEWIKAVRQLCDQYGILMIADEVQSGFCRTGRMFASEYWKEAGVMPDIIATAKSIAAGIPLSAIIAREEIMESIAPGTIGGTFCGNPLACAAALKTIEIMERDHLAERACAIGEKVMARYRQMMEKYPVIGDVRGMGAMVGIEFVKDRRTKTPAPGLTSAVIDSCASMGLIVESAGTYHNVIRFLAPLVITDEQLEAGLDIFEKAIAANCGATPPSSGPDGSGTDGPGTDGKRAAESVPEFSYYLPVNIIFGCGKTARVGELTKPYGTKALIVTGRSSARKSGLYDRVAASLEAAGISHLLFDRVTQNPLTTTAAEGAAFAREHGCDVVVGIGGGSVMDCAKAIAFLAVNSGDISDYIFNRLKSSDALPIVLIPTTCGTGSEGNGFAVLTNPENGDKKSLRCNAIVPKVSIVDPECMMTMPKSVLASVGFDALCHCMEAYTSRISQPFTDRLSEYAMELIAGNLVTVCRGGGDRKAWESLSLASTIGGMAINTAGVTLAHGMEHPVSGLKDVIHGHGLAALTPVVIEASQKGSPEKYAWISRILGGTGSDDCADAVRRLLKELELDCTLTDLGIVRDDIPWMAANCMKVSAAGVANNPVVFTEKEIAALYEAAM